MLHRVALHSYQLIFTDAYGTVHNFTATLPKDIRALITQLEKNK